MLRGELLLENRTVGRIYQMTISCFLIDMNFISKMFGNLFNIFVSSSDPHLHNSWYKVRYLKFLKKKTRNNDTKTKTTRYTQVTQTCTQSLNTKTKNTLDTHTSILQKMILRYENLIFFKDVPIFSWICFSILVLKTGPGGSRFSRLVGRSENVLKNTAIDQESLISHLGMIETNLNP